MENPEAKRFILRRFELDTTSVRKFGLKVESDHRSKFPI